MKNIAFIITIAIFSAAHAQQRIVLIEQFTNSGCPPCASNTPVITQYVDNNPATTIAIAYHTGFPYNDSMYHENSAESNARVAYYSVNSVPYTVVDGNVFAGTSGSLIPNLNSVINARAAQTPDYSITSSGWSINGSNLQGSFNFTSLAQANINDSLHAFIVVIEKVVLKSSYLASPGNNSETVYKYVMRKMLPGDNGTLLTNRQLNGSDVISESWNIQNIKSLSEVRVVAFVQNIVTKEVYQAVMSVPLLNGIESTQVASPFNISPNPAIENIAITWQDAIIRSYIIADYSGRIVLSAKVDNAASGATTIPITQLPSGSYMFIITTDNNEIYRQPFLKI